MAKITLNSRDIEAPDGAPLVEVIKNSGTFISNLCYIDGLPPYAGCRKCGRVRGLQARGPLGGGPRRCLARHRFPAPYPLNDRSPEKARTAAPTSR